MDIRLENIGKRFNRDWIFKGLELEIRTGSRLAITGANGSGKSTLMKIIGGYTLPTKGKVLLEQKNPDMEDSQLHFTLAAPYFNLIEELTLAEFLKFHKNFKKEINPLEAVKTAGLKQALNKPIKDFSSGMKQRVKLIMAFCYESEIILLDEPTTNLDSAGIEWFIGLYRTVPSKRTIILASNISQEIVLAEETFEII